MSGTVPCSLKSLSSAETFTAKIEAAEDRSREWHYNYSSIVGFFIQDSERPTSGRGDTTEENFGLLEQDYDTDKLLPNNGKAYTQWQRFAHKLKMMNQSAQNEMSYRLLYLGRHGQGYHNVGITFYGDAAWDCYYGAFDRDPSYPGITYRDAHLTSLGRHQAKVVSKLWQNLMSTQKMPAPQSFYCSPLTRAMQTAQLTFSDLTLLPDRPFRPVVKELLRERYGLQPCDLRPTKSYIQTNFPDFRIEESFTEDDELYSAIRREPPQRHDRRVRTLLDDVFKNDDSTYVSMTSHGGTIEAILRVVAHSVVSLPPGGVIPILVRISKVSGRRHDEGDEQEWEAQPACVSDPTKAGKEGYKNIAEFLYENDRSVRDLD